MQKWRPSDQYHSSEQQADDKNPVETAMFSQQDVAEHHDEDGRREDYSSGVSNWQTSKSYENSRHSEAADDTLEINKEAEVLGS